MSYLKDCISNNQLTHGPMVSQFESMFAEMLNVKHAVMCSSGTTALHLALLAAGIGPGDQVLVPDLTFVATANAVMHAGATPVLVDIDPDDWGISLDAAERQITPYTRAIIPVHLYGNPVNMALMREFAEQYNLLVIEDAAEGLGGVWNDRWLGTYGKMGTFSFYGNKVLTTGEGGAVVTDDDNMASRLRHFRGQGQHPTRRYYHDVVGYNYRMTDLQAAVGLGQLYILMENLELRWNLMRMYYERLQLPGVQTVQFDAAPWLFTLVLPASASREAVMESLLRKGVDTRPAFVPLHRMPMYEGQDIDFPEACRVGDRGLSLPTYPGLKMSDAEEVADSVREILIAIRDQ